MEMAQLVAAILFVGLLAFRVPIGYALSAAAAAGLYAEGGFRMVDSGVSTAFSTVNGWVLITVPLFVFMAAVLVETGSATDMYRVLSNLLGRLPGGAGLATVSACSIFSAVTGSSVVCAATIGTSSIPELLALKYDRRLIKGILAAGGTLGILIPPSIPMILYGAMVDLSIGDLFVAGVLPGLMLGATFAGYILFVAWRDPARAPKAPPVPRRELLSGVPQTLPIVIVIAFVLGGIWFGIVTPTEAAAVGVAVVVIAALLQRKLNWSAFSKATMSSVQTTGMLGVLLIGAFMFGHLVTLWRIPQAVMVLLNEWQLPPFGILIGFIVLLFIMGTLIDGTSILLITTPIFYPVLTGLGFDPIWYGVVLVLMIEVGLITPPVGMNLFIIQGLRPKEPIAEVMRGAWPFVGLMMFGLLLLIIWPEIVLWLPRMMHAG